MPKLLKHLHNERGSILVASIAFSIIIAIAGTGMLLLSGNSVRHEATAYENDKAFLAAESGLLLGKRWLADTGNWNYYSTRSGTHVIYTGIINNVFDTVTLLVPIGSGDLELISEATSTDLGFKKRLSWGIQKEVGLNPGVFINDLDPGQKVPGQGGINDIWFDGPFHSNMPIKISSVSNPQAKGASVYFVNGNVTVHNRLEKIHFENGDWGDFKKGNNDYEYGIYRDNLQQSTNESKKLDQYFQGTFTHSQDSLYMPRIVGQDILLPVNQSTTKRALLFFDVPSDTGKATYYYYDASGLQSITFNINNKVIRVQNAISVLGTVKGQTTVVTDPGYNIYPIGNLTYSDFSKDTANNSYNYINYNNVNNYGVGTIDNGHTNIIALASGGDIRFEAGHRKVVVNKTTGALDSVTTSNDVLYLTASLIAIEPGHGLMWDTVRTGNDITIKQSEYYYSLRAIGSRTMDHFFNFTEAGGSNFNNLFRFYLDTRILQNFRAPGVPEFKSIGSTGVKLFILKTDWREQNIPL